MANAKEYMRQQTRDLMRALNDVGQHPVGVATPEQTLQAGPLASWEWDSAGGGNKAFVRTRPSAPKEYWAHVDFDGYRAAFLSFLEREFALSASTVESSWHVDHMLNRAFARSHGIAFVRLALLGRDSNVSYGRLLESGFSKIKANSKPMYLIDFVIMMKLLDIPAPTSKQDYSARRQVIASTFVANGFEGSEELAMQGLDGMFALWSVLK